MIMRQEHDANSKCYEQFKGGGVDIPRVIMKPFWRKWG